MGGLHGPSCPCTGAGEGVVAATIFVAVCPIQSWGGHSATRMPQGIICTSRLSTNEDAKPKTRLVGSRSVLTGHALGGRGCRQDNLLKLPSFS